MEEYKKLLLEIFESVLQEAEQEHSKAPALNSPDIKNALMISNIRMGSVLATMLMGIGMTAYTQGVREKEQECLEYVGAARHKCREMIKSEASKKAIERINSKRSMCKQSNNPSQCQQMVDKLILKYKMKQ